MASRAKRQERETSILFGCLPLPESSILPCFMRHHTEGVCEGRTKEWGASKL
jgi:hypothetical protein